jgi:hypothetical protein
LIGRRHRPVRLLLLTIQARCRERASKPGVASLKEIMTCDGIGAPDSYEGRRHQKSANGDAHRRVSLLPLITMFKVNSNQATQRKVELGVA